MGAPDQLRDTVSADIVPIDFHPFASRTKQDPFFDFQLSDSPDPPLYRAELSASQSGHFTLTPRLQFVHVQFRLREKFQFRRLRLLPRGLRLRHLLRRDHSHPDWPGESPAMTFSTDRRPRHICSANVHDRRAGLRLSLAWLAVRPELHRCGERVRRFLGTAMWLLAFNRNWIYFR